MRNAHHVAAGRIGQSACQLPRAGPSTRHPPPRAPAVLSITSADLGQTTRTLAQRLGASLGDAARGLADYALRRRLRVAVTGLSRSGKTVFLTALLHNLHL